MKFFFVLLLLSSGVLADTDPVSHKKGLVLGIGAAGTRYIFPAEFEGREKKDLDDKTTLIGGVLQLGYDHVIFNRLLLGLRTEGLITDSLGMGNKDSNVLTGKMRGASFLLRVGGLIHTQTFDMVGDPAPMTLEIFGEAGVTSAHRNFGKKYFSASGDEYVDNLEEELQGQVLSGGLSLTNLRGAFLELKAMRTSVTHTRQKFTGYKIENGGAAVSNDRTRDDGKNFTTFLMVIGHHF